MPEKLTISSHTGRTVLRNNEEFLVFAGTAYLGIPQNETFRNLLIEGFQRFGTNYGSSRNGNVVFGIYEEAETRLAAMVGSDAALTVSSGMLAGQLVLRQFEDHAHLFISPGIHPALRPLNYQSRIQTYEQWTDHVLKELRSHKFPEAVIFLNTIDILHAKRYDLRWLQALPDDLRLIVVIDDSHGFGLIGEQGAGHWPLLPKSPSIERIMVSSMGKALGLPGGVIAGSENRINKIKSDGVFVGGSPLIPAYLHAFVNSQSIYEQERDKLRTLRNHFAILTESLKKTITSEGLPVFHINNTEIAEKLLHHHILLSSFPYPTPQSEPVTRVVLNSTHIKEDIEQLANALKTYL